MGIKLEKPLRFVCDDNCDNCVVRFKCYTQRGVLQLEIEDILRIEKESLLQESRS